VEDKDILDIQEGENVGCEGGYAAEESEAFYSDGEVFRLHPIPAKLTDTWPANTWLIRMAVWCSIGCGIGDGTSSFRRVGKERA
jgi:hypothetical protein